MDVREFPNNHADIVSRFFPNHATTNSEGLMNAANLIPYFGMPSGGLDNIARDSRMMDHFQFPHAYNGYSEYLGGVTMGLVVEKLEWLYSEPYGLPIREAQANEVNFDMTIFQESYLEQIPEEGVGRVMSSAVTKGRASLLRRGKAIFLEHGFWKTNVGKRHYARQVQQVANATANTFQMDALVKLVNIRPRDVKWMADFWFRGKTTKDILEHYISRFARLNKGSYEAEHMVNEYTEILEARGKGPEVIIAPRGVEPLFVGAENSDKLDIDKVGPGLAEQRMLQVASRMTRFAGLPMKFTRRYLNFIGNQLPLDPLQRGRLFGEFVQLPPLRADHDIFTTGKLPNGQDYKYSADHQQLQMMDYQHDCERTIKKKDLLPYLRIFDENDEFVIGCKPTNERELKKHKHVQSPFEYRMNGNIYACKLFGQIPLELVTVDALRAMSESMPHGGLVSNELLQNCFYPNGAVAYIDMKAFNTYVTGGFKNRKSIHQQYKQAEVTMSIDTETKPAELAKLRSLGVVSYGRFLSGNNTVKSTPVVDIKQKNDQVLSQLATLNAHVPYGTLLSKLESDELKNAAVERSFYLLSRNNADEIKQELLEPLNAIHTPSTTSTKTEIAKQEKKLIGQLTAPVPQHVSTSLKPTDSSLVSMGFDLFDENAINEAKQQGFDFEEVAKLPLDEFNSVEEVKTFFDVLQHKAHVGAGLSAKNDPSVIFNKATGTYSPEVQDIFHRIENIMPMMRLKINMALLLFQKLNKTFFELLNKHNIYDPFLYIISRPHVHVVTNTVLIGTGGSRLGNTLVRQPDCMIGDNATDKTHLVFMTMYNTAVVVNHLLMCVVDDVSIHDYRGCGNTRFMTSEQFGEFSASNFEIPDNDDAGALYVIIAAVPDKERFPKIFSLDRSLLDNPNDPSAGPAAYFHDNQWLLQYTRQTPNDLHPYHWDDQVANKILCQIPQKLYNPVSGKFDAYISGEDSHLGGYHYPGMMKALRSGKRILDKPVMSDKMIDWYSI